MPVALLVLLFQVLTISSVSQREQGLWSVEATSLLVPFGSRTEIPSPDGRWQIVVQRTDLYLVSKVVSKGKAKKLVPAGEIQPLAEVIWSPDSKALAITASDGGWVGTWDVYVLLRKRGRLTRIEITQKVREDFARRFKCDELPGAGPQEPNIGALTWLRDSTTLLLLAEVPPVGTCPEMKKLTGYAISVPSGNILDFYSEREIRSRWGYLLGSRHKEPPSELR